MEEKKKPTIIRAGRGVKAKVWTNQGKHGDYQSITFSRVYKDAKDEFQDSDTFYKDELLQVAWAAVMAYSHCQEETNKK